MVICHYYMVFFLVSAYLYKGVNMLTIMFGIIIWILIVAVELGIIYLIEKKTKKELTEAEAMAAITQMLFLFPLSFVIALVMFPVV